MGWYECGVLMLQEALGFAVERHSGQWRDGEGALPYACHAVEVASLLRHVGGVTSKVELAAAFLHDLVEETGTELGEIEAVFGGEVAELVGEVTRWEPGEAERAGKSAGEVYAMRTAALLEEIARMSDGAQRIKLADRLSNLREAKRTRGPKRLARYLDQTRAILGVTRRSSSPALWDALAGELD